jgi:bifunctional non-homologous end joining protein LigD
MPLARLRAPFDHPDWIFEPKLDGFRAVAYVERGNARLVSRKQNVYKSFPTLTAALGTALRVSNAVVDGEIVHLGPDGAPLFYELMRRRTPQHFMAFDLLWLDGRDLRGVPLLERKGLLRDIVPPQPSPLAYVDHVVETGVDLYCAVCERDTEGVVAKLATGAYTPEATTWVKIKNPGYTQAEGRADFFSLRQDALLTRRRQFADFSPELSSAG